MFFVPFHGTATPPRVKLNAEKLVHVPWVNSSAEPQPLAWLCRCDSGQFINTGLLFLLVYGTGPSGYETPQILKDLSIFSGPYTDFSRDWQVGFEVVFRVHGLEMRSWGRVLS